FRGGLGVVKSQRVLTPGFISVECERRFEAPVGLFGGHDGTTGRNLIWNTDDPENAKDMYSKFSGYQYKANDVLTDYGRSGGGYGDPLERPAEMVHGDVLDEFCTREAAYEVYGVVLDEQLQLDQAATRERRKELEGAKAVS